MTTLAFFLEEASAEAMLKGILPRYLPEETEILYHAFDGKQSLKKHLVRRLRLWQKPDTRFIVLCDQDSGKCEDIKRELARLCAEAGHPEALVRIACHELESFYLGDLAAVEAGLGLRRLSREQNRSKYRKPDRLANAAEELRKLSGDRYQKIAGSRAIAPHLCLDEGGNASASFRALLSGIRRVFEAA
ncbi:MAG: DUF4276 family protein [Candidatus Accumulibacter sp.]|jgi:hypothetical protein|nr:DUF4276 family protein [Accumulibacter sp.]